MEYLTIKEAAALLRVHPETVRRWTREGKIVYLQAGHFGRIHIPRSAIDGLIKNSRHGDKEEP